MSFPSGWPTDPVSPGGGSAAWGDITGTLSAQTDLAAALAAKQASRQVETGLEAATTQTQGQGALTYDVGSTDIVAIVTTCANANDVITLPSVATDCMALVINLGAETLQVFPASGDDLGQGTDASTTIAAGASATFYGVSSSAWHAMGA